MMNEQAKEECLPNDTILYRSGNVLLRICGCWVMERTDICSDDLHIHLLRMNVHGGRRFGIGWLLRVG